MAVDVHVPDAEEGAEIEVVALNVEAGATVAEGDVLEATQVLMRIDD
jgi:pyruvate/2-oxoglutarate dehydrogenase complex dihydrolipoamide acyltransferase (E2) component